MTPAPADLDAGEVFDDVSPDSGDEPDPDPAGEPDDAEPRDTGRGQDSLVREGDIAADYLEGLLDIADLDGDIDMDVEGDRAIVSIVGGELGNLVGSGGEVLDALQELTRL